MSKSSKTNAMRILESNNIHYTVDTYDIKDGLIDGISVANKVGKPVETVFKTLVAQGQSKELFVFVIPVADELDLKKAARISNQKKVEMIPVKDIQKHTGYMRGGCSPIGMKKHYITFIHTSAEKLPKIVVSGGKKGIQIELDVHDLCSITSATLTDLIK